MMLGAMDMINDDEDSDDSLSIDNEMQLNGVMGDDDEYEDDDDEDPDVYFQKFDEEINSNYILKQHPEQFNKNYDEIETLSAIIRDNNNNIIDSLHKTIPYLTKYERSRVLGQRAKQINSGSKPYVAVPDNIIDGYIIAQMELAQKRIPFIIQRPIYGGACEYWKLKDLEILV
jgi:DNA-directed RNA polymerase subunit K/omega